MSLRAIHLRRPRTRGECPPAAEPCRFVTCRHHLWTERVLDRLGRVLDFRETAAWGDTEHTCALREAERGGLTLDRIARIYGLSRERIRQIEGEALRRCRRLIDVGDSTEGEGSGADGLHRDPTSEDTGLPERHGRDDTGLPEFGDEDSTPGPSEARRAQWAASKRRRRRALAAMAEASPLIPCPRCGGPMRALTRRGKPREVCGPACAHRHPPGLGPSGGPVGKAGDAGRPFSPATGAKRGSHCSHGG